MKYGFGVDVGGTTVKLGLLSEAGELLEKWELPTRTENGGENILPDIAQGVQDCMTRHGLDRADCIGLGIGVPGPVDASGMVNRCVNLNWGVFNLHDALGILTGLRVRAGNDANCAALGEFWMGGGSGCRSAIFVTLGTGIGGGVIVDGRLLTGAHGVGGGVSRAGDYLLRGVERHFRAHMFHACKDTQFALATLGNDAGMYGAFRLLA